MQKRVADALVVVLAIALPARHLWPLDGGFYVDWPNHEWIVGYFGAFFRAHHTMPLVLNTTTAGGIAVPVFYGNLLYPALGVFSSVLSAGLVIRLGAILMFALQFGLVSHALHRISVPRYLARICGCLVIWEIYPLTNLYNRAAVVEFFATAALVCGVSAMVVLFHAETRRERTRYAAGAMLALTFAAGSHPITAMYAVPLFVLLAPVFWWLLRDDATRRIQIVKALAPWLVTAVICVLPWLLAAREYSNVMVIRSSAADVTVSKGWDDFSNRMSPLPHDPHIIPGKPLAEINTPYLDAQISIPLLVVFLALGVLAIVVARRRSRAPAIVFAISLTFFAFFTWLSVSTTGYRLFPKIFVMIQYAYRAVTYENLSLLLGIFLLAMTLRPIQDLQTLLSRRAINAVASAMLLLAGIGVIIKWDHIAAVKTVGNNPHIISRQHDRRTYVNLPKTYYGLNAYSTDTLVLKTIPEGQNLDVHAQSFKIETDSKFGDPKPMKLDFAKPTWVMTDVLSFPWSRLLLDGWPIDMRAHYDQLALLVPPGPHTVTTDFVPPPSWRALRTISLVLLFLWCGFAVVEGFLSLRRRGESVSR